MLYFYMNFQQNNQQQNIKIIEFLKQMSILVFNVVILLLNMSEKNKINELYSNLLQKNTLNQQIITKYYKYTQNNKSKLAKNKLNKQRLPKIKQINTNEFSKHEQHYSQPQLFPKPQIHQHKSQIISLNTLKTVKNVEETFLKKKSEILTKHKLIQSNKIVANPIGQDLRFSSRSLSKKTPLKLQNIIFQSKKIIESQASIKNQLKIQAKKKIYKYRQDSINESKENVITQYKRTTQRQKILEKELVMGIKGVFYEIKIQNSIIKNTPL